MGRDYGQHRGCWASSLVRTTGPGSPQKSVKLSTGADTETGQVSVPEASLHSGSMDAGVRSHILATNF